MIIRTIIIIMTKFTYFRSIFLLLTALIFLSSCEALKYRPVDAKEYPPEPEKRVKKNLEEGKGFRLFGDDDEKGGNFDFASSNPLWRASLETIDFMPLASADPFSGIIITDWYSNNKEVGERCKLNIFVKGKEMRTENLKVNSFCQKIDDKGQWIDQEISLNNNIQLENAILNKAKKIRLSQN